MLVVLPNIDKTCLVLLLLEELIVRRTFSEMPFFLQTCNVVPTKLMIQLMNKEKQVIRQRALNETSLERFLGYVVNETCQIATYLY